MLPSIASVVVGLLEDRPDLTVHDGSPPAGTTPPYVVAWVSIDNEQTSRFCSDTDLTALRVTTHSVASTGQGARIVASGVRAALLDITPAVDGWTCWPIRHEYGLPPQWDESTGAAWITAIDGWTLTATPARKDT